MQEISLTSSVGSGGENASHDVLNVQKALNRIAEKIGLSEPLAEDCQIGPEPQHSSTCHAIGLLQSNILGYANPDNRIDRNGKSHQALNQELNATYDIAPGLFLPKIEPEQGLSEDDYQHAAQLLGCEVAAIKAVSDVESSGSGFFESGTPCILFEAHQFSKYSHHHFDESHPDISSRQWDRTLYIGGEREYERLQKAMELDRRAALKSTSFGRYQIMGFNYGAAGYNDVESFVRDMFLAERHHLIAFVHFIKSDSRLLNAIQSLDWPTFARCYNGPGYAENMYDLRLQAAYECYCG